MTQHGNPSIEDSKTARTAMIEVVKLAGVIIQQIRDNSIIVFLFISQNNENFENNNFDSSIICQITCQQFKLTHCLNYTGIFMLVR